MKTFRRRCRGCQELVFRRCSSNKHDHVNCLLSGVELSATCWRKQDEHLAKICMECMQHHRGPATMSPDEKDRAIRELFAVMLRGALALQTYLIGLGTDRRQTLLSISAPALRQHLTRSLGNLDRGAPLKQVRLTGFDDLPLGLAEGLRSYEKRVRSRLDRLEKNGHTRSIEYVRRRMNPPVRYARFLAAEGVTHWNQVTRMLPRAEN